MSLCGRWSWRLVSAHGGQWHEFVSPDWQFDYRRRVAGEAKAEMGGCDGAQRFAEWCDTLEVWCDGDIAESFIVESIEPDGEGNYEITGVGAFELARKRRIAVTETLTGSAGQVWAELWQIMNGIAPTGLTPTVTSGGPSITLELTAGDLFEDPLGTLGVYVTWAQHGGVLYDWLAGEEPRQGRPLTYEWVTSFTCDTQGMFDAGSVVNNIEFAYGPSLESLFVWPENGNPDGKLLQSPRLNFPEITDREQMRQLANQWGPTLAAPEPVLPDIALNPATTQFMDLLPGVWHNDQHTPHVGYAFNMAAVELEGTSDCLETITAGMDQGDSAIRNTLR